METAWLAMHPARHPRGGLDISTYCLCAFFIYVALGAPCSHGSETITCLNLIVCRIVNFVATI
jgi:hypothetical protein